MFDLASEEEIISKWSGNKDFPLVSIECITYNHEEYIEKTLQGFMSQETDFAFEVLVHDDASTDRTAEIVRRYEERYPRIIRAVYQTDNQYSQGVSPDEILFKMFRGKYIAFCEGDDYWSDPLKLSKQIGALRENPQCDLCFHSAERVDYLTGESCVMGRYKSESGLVSVEDIIEKKYGQIPTASLMIKIEAAREVREFISQLSYQKVTDVYLQIIGAIKGEAYYLDEPMSVYHCYIPGSWSAGLLTDSTTMLEHVESKIISYEMLDEMSRYRYSESFRNVNAKWVSIVMRNLNVPVKIKREFYLDYSHYLSPREKMLAFMCLRFPALLRWGKKAKKSLFLKRKRSGSYRFNPAAEGSGAD